MPSKTYALPSALAGLILTLAAAGAEAAVIHYEGALAPEAPGATGTGSVDLFFDDLTHELTFDVSFAGLSAPTIVAHLHAPTTDPFTGAAIVAVTSPTLAGFPVGVTAGTYLGTFDLDLPSNFNPAFLTAAGGTTDGAMALLLGSLNEGRAYLNIHTTAFPGGEIRGFATPAREAIPEPQTWGLMIMGFAAAGALLRARRVRAA
jgi:hypothetical protein